MRESLKKIFVPALFVAVTAFPLSASGAHKSRHPNCTSGSINSRQDRQDQRIRQGVGSGELTRRETRRLAAQEARIRVDEAYARRSGGEFTAGERARIQRELNRASRNIYRQKHDTQDRN